jgi:hypothetical protein
MKRSVHFILSSGGITSGCEAGLIHSMVTIGNTESTFDQFQYRKLSL